MKQGSRWILLLLLFSVTTMFAQSPPRLLRSSNMRILVHSDSIHNHTCIEHLVDQNVHSEAFTFQRRHEQRGNFQGFSNNCLINPQKLHPVCLNSNYLPKPYLIEFCGSRGHCILSTHPKRVLYQR